MIACANACDHVYVIELVVRVIVVSSRLPYSMFIKLFIDTLNVERHYCSLSLIITNNMNEEDKDKEKENKGERGRGR